MYTLGIPYDNNGPRDEDDLVESTLSFFCSLMLSSSITFELQSLNERSELGESSVVSDSMDAVLPFDMTSPSVRTVPNRTRRLGLPCFLFFSDESRSSLPA